MDIKSVLTESGFGFSKSLGQNFITDVNFLRAVVSDSGITKSDTAVEVGAGAGTLTRELAAAANRVISYEIDSRLQPVLNRTLADAGNVTLVFKDILKESRESLASFAPEGYKVAANLPYYVTTPVIFYFLDDPLCRSLTVTVQREVADRLCAPPDTPAYGALTAQVALLGGAKFMRAAPRSLFYPVPNVDSAVVRIDVCKRGGITDLALLKRVIASAFAMRRKTLANNLMRSFGIGRDVALSVLAAAGIPESARGETLGTDSFMKLADALAGAGAGSQASG